jgi:DNA invertase Pin-like site-specific DNA recombinase
MANAKDGKWTAIYLRVSSTNQRDDSQALAVEQYVSAQGLTSVRYYRDKASGSNLERPAFQRLQADVFAGRVSSVIVWRLDRLARNLKDGVNTLADWCERGIRVVSVSQQLDFNGAVGKMIAAVLLGVAEMERENINERIRAGLAARKAKGLPMGRAKGDVGHPWRLEKRRIDVALARSLRQQGVSCASIASRFGVTRPTVYAALRSQ